MPDAFDIWQHDRRCVCPHPDARECLEMRYRRGPGQPPPGLGDEECCDCMCHAMYEYHARADE